MDRSPTNIPEGILAWALALTTLIIFLSSCNPSHLSCVHKLDVILEIFGSISGKVRVQLSRLNRIIVIITKLLMKFSGFFSEAIYLCPSLGRASL